MNVSVVGWLVRFSPPVLRPSVRVAKKLFPKITTDPFYGISIRINEF